MLAKYLVGLSAIATLLGACQDSGSIKGTGEKKPAGGTAYVPASAADGVKPTPTPVAKSRYNLEVFKHYDVPEQKMSICNGVVTMTIWSDFGGMAPQGVIDCLMFGKMDLGKMIPKAEELEAIDPATMKQYSGFGKVLRLPNPVSKAYTFSPPLPMIIGPLVQNNNDYKEFVFKDQITLSFTHPTKGAMTDKGSVYYEVKDHVASMTPEGTSFNFDKIIHYERRVDGFANVPDRGSRMLFSKMEFWYNTQPIAIPQLIIRAMPSQMGGFAGGLAAIGDQVLGPLTIKLSLISHTQL